MNQEVGDLVFMELLAWFMLRKTTYATQWNMAVGKGFILVVASLISDLDNKI